MTSRTRHVTCAENRRLHWVRRFELSLRQFDVHLCLLAIVFAVRVKPRSRWRLGGVLACGMANGLLYERGSDLFDGHQRLLYLCLFSIPVLAGLLTPETPAFTTAVLALTSYPPLNDMEPIPTILWPFYAAAMAHQSTGLGHFFELMIVFVAAAGIAMIASLLMYIPYGCLVYVGWTARIISIKAFRSGT